MKISDYCFGSRKVLAAVALFMFAVGGRAFAADEPIYLAQSFARPMIMAPIVNSFRAIEVQRHQSRTRLYRDALKVLKENPAAADVAECPLGDPEPGQVCLRVAKKVEEPAQAQAVPATTVSLAKKDGAAAGKEKKPASDVVPPVVAKVVPAEPKRRKVAVLFGNNAYPLPIPPLDTPIADVEEIARILEDRFGYETLIVRDAKKADVVASLNRLGSDSGTSDSVVIFYAGHGYLMDDTKMGYWIPVDGSVKSPDNWISNTDISKFLKNIQAKQLILVSDSCFSGSLTKEEKVSSNTDGIERIWDKRSVLAMSSGGEEPVSDEGKEGHSIFAWSLIKALKSAEASTPGVKVFELVKNDVVKEYEQQPQYGAVVSAGHMEGGEYLFERRQGK